MKLINGEEILKEIKESRNIILPQKSVSNFKLDTENQREKVSRERSKSHRHTITRMNTSPSTNTETEEKMPKSEVKCIESDRGNVIIVN